MEKKSGAEFLLPATIFVVLLVVPTIITGDSVSDLTLSAHSKNNPHRNLGRFGSENFPNSS